MFVEIWSQRPKFRRAEKPPPMCFQPRDGAILEAIHDYDGVMARRHLKEMFWPTSSWQAVERRLSLLYHNGYLDWPSKEQRRTKPIPEPIVWLGWKGALWISGQAGVDVAIPQNDGENKLRQLAKDLRNQGIRWLREPRWIQLVHDIAVNDFRLTMEQAIYQQPNLTLEEWLPEGSFLSKADVVSYSVKGSDGNFKNKKKGVRPDGYFVIEVGDRSLGESQMRARFLLELDQANYDNPRFGREKVLPGIAYIKSADYKARFGANSGRWLVVTTGERRMMNIKRQTEKEAGDGAASFYFTTFDQVRHESVLTAPIWLRGGDNQLFSLFNS
jgi:hypothetical protein